MDRLHIAMFTNVYLPLTNGVVTSVVSFRQGLTARGHVVFVMAPHPTESYQGEERFVFRYPAWELPLQRYPLTLPVSPFVDRMLPCLQPDVIHAHHPVMLGRVAAKKSFNLRVPLVFTYHTRYHDYAHYIKGVPDHLVKEFLENWLANFMRKCHHVVVPSASTRDMLEDIYGISTRVSVVATGVNPSRFGRIQRNEARSELAWDQDELILVSIGRLAKEKNWELLLQAFRLSGASRLVIIGGGEEREHLESVCRGLGIADSVTFTGPVPFDQVPTYLSAGDIFCFASVTETQGLVTLEAMASGLPVVAVDASGTRDVLTDGRDGFLTPCHSEALAEKLKVLLADPQLRQSLGRAALKRSAAFNVEAQSARLEAVYRVAIADHAAGYRVPVQADSSTTGLRKFFSYFNRNESIAERARDAIVK